MDRNEKFSEKEIEEMFASMSDEDLDDSDADSNYCTESGSDGDSTDSEDFLVKRPKLSASTDVQASTSMSETTVYPSESSSVTTPASVSSNEPSRYANIQWGMPAGRQKFFSFTAVHGMDPDVRGILALAEPIDYFTLFLTPDILQLMVDETNLYATQEVLSSNAGPKSRMHNWEPTNVNEMKSFVALLGYMGLVVAPRIADYWSTTDLYQFSFPRKMMSRNRFEILLKFWHFNDKSTEDKRNRLAKCERILNMFIKNFQEAYTPGRKVCIDESMIPFRGRLSFRQYIPSKSHKYGIKVYKLCTGNGYTWNMTVYVGRDSVDGEYSASENVVMKLTKDLLNAGRTLYMDNYYTGIPLVYRLLDNSTHSVGTLRANRKYIPEAVQKAKLKKGEHIEESPEGVTVLKWCDSRDV